MKRLFKLFHKQRKQVKLLEEAELDRENPTSLDKLVDKIVKSIKENPEGWSIVERNHRFGFSLDFTNGLINYSEHSLQGNGSNTSAWICLRDKHKNILDILAAPYHKEFIRLKDLMETERAMNNINKLMELVK